MQELQMAKVPKLVRTILFFCNFEEGKLGTAAREWRCATLKSQALQIKAMGNAEVDEEYLLAQYEVADVSNGNSLIEGKLFRRSPEARMRSINASLTV